MYACYSNFQTTVFQTVQCTVRLVLLFSQPIDKLYIYTVLVCFTPNVQVYVFRCAGSQCSKCTVGVQVLYPTTSTLYTCSVHCAGRISVQWVYRCETPTTTTLYVEKNKINITFGKITGSRGLFFESLHNTFLPVQRGCYFQKGDILIFNFPDRCGCRESGQSICTPTVHLLCTMYTYCTLTFNLSRGDIMFEVNDRSFVRSVPFDILYPDHKLSRLEDMLQTFLMKVVECAYATQDDDLRYRYNVITDKLIQLWWECVGSRHEELYAGVCLMYSSFQLNKEDEEVLHDLLCGALCDMLHTVR